MSRFLPTLVTFGVFAVFSVVTIHESGHKSASAQTLDRRLTLSTMPTDNMPLVGMGNPNVDNMPLVGVGNPSQDNMASQGPGSQYGLQPPVGSLPPDTIFLPLVPHDTYVAPPQQSPYAGLDTIISRDNYNDTEVMALPVPGGCLYHQSKGGMAFSPNPCALQAPGSPQ